MLTRGVDRAALQHRQGTIPSCSPALSKGLWAERPFGASPAASIPRMTPTPLRQVFIHGLTHEGKVFRPSDWAERLAGAMSCFRPEGTAGGAGARIGYSPYCVPNKIDGVSCVIVNEALREIEPMAWDFVMNFARDNNLKTAEADERK